MTLLCCCCCGDEDEFVVDIAPVDFHVAVAFPEDNEASYSEPELMSVEATTRPKPPVTR